jgi:hypothetical protein
MTTAMISSAMLKHDDVPRYLFSNFPNMEEQGLAKSRALDSLRRQIAAHTAIGVEIDREIEELQEQLMTSFTHIQKSRCFIIRHTRSKADLDVWLEIGKAFWGPVHRLHILDPERYESVKREMAAMFSTLKEEMPEQKQICDVSHDIKYLLRDDVVQEKEEARLISLRDEKVNNLTHITNLKASLEQYKKW